MRYFRSGRIHRAAVPWHLRRFSPVAALNALEEVDLQEAHERGKRLILLDVDNTLLPWRAEDVGENTLLWIQEAKELGFDLCIISNTRNPERLKRIAGKLGIDFIRDRFKPSRRMYHLATKKFGHTEAETLMIGDQLLTDIWGANRAGIDAIWVKPIGPTEFVGTKYISRNIERVIGRLLHDHFQESPTAIPEPGFFGHEIFAQLIKFALVGGAATFIDVGLHYFLMFRAQIGGVPLREVAGTWAIHTFNLNWPLDDGHIADAAYAPLKVVPVLLAIIVSYLLNRLYTFKMTHERIRMAQILQFYTVALIGMVISVTVGTIGQRLADANPKLEWAAGTIVGIIAGFIWNFNGQRLWTFRKKHVETP